jgi:hypothetical protein
MKHSKVRLREGGYTLADIMVASGLTVLAGIIGVYAMNSGAILYAKNTAQNLAHDSSRIAVNRLLHDIHNAVSVPQLGHIDYRTPGTYTAPANSWVPYGTNVTFYADSGTGPNAGVSFQMMGGPNGNTGGPFNVINDPGNPDLIQIGPTSPGPQAGMRLVFPYYNMEDDISKVTSNGNNHYNVWTKNALEVRFKTKKNTYYICYYTTRYAYVVENKQLRLYSSAPPPAGFTWPLVVARNISSATPFTQTSTQYVGIDLSTEDTRYSNRSYRAVNTLLAGSVPYRAQLCISR